MKEEFDNDENSPVFRRIAISAGLLLLVSASLWFFFLRDSKPAERPVPEPSVVNITLPPPPRPPPPPPRERPPEDDVREQVSEFIPEDAAATPDEAPADDTPAALGTGIVGDGPPDAFGLGTKGGGGGFGRIGGSGGGGSRFGAYAGKVQRVVADRLRTHRKTRTAEMSVRVRIWADGAGRITRASLAGSTGDAELDQALATEVLSGLQLPAPPPSDMPMPIVLQLSGRRP